MESVGPFGVAIDGAGFFAISRDRERGFTHSGAFTRAGDKTFLNAEDWTLADVHAPEDATEVGVARDGRITMVAAPSPRSAPDAAPRVRPRITVS